MARHVAPTIGEGSLGYRRKAEAIAAEDGLPARSSQGLLAGLATCCRMQASTPVNDRYLFTLYARPTATLQRAFELLGITPDRTR